MSEICQYVDYTVVWGKIGLKKCWDRVALFVHSTSILHIKMKANQKNLNVDPHIAHYVFFLLYQDCCIMNKINIPPAKMCVKKPGGHLARK